jgi:HEPN domain-containing protein
MDNEILLNNFATRSFRDIADQDYIAARLSYRAYLIPQFLWQSLQAIEKYMKCILVLNRIYAPKTHELSGLFKDFEAGKFAIRFSDESKRFIEYVDTYGRFRYFEVPYYTTGRELFSLDRTVWEIRRYAAVLDYELRNAFDNGKRMLELELEAIKGAESRPYQEFRLVGGHLEDIINKPDHPSRPGLILGNAFFGKSRRKTVRYRHMSSARNFPLSLYPNIVDDVVKYVWLPNYITEAYRQLHAIKKKAERLKQKQAIVS